MYEIDINTMCRQTDAADRFGKPIYEQDILLYETAEEIGYFIVQDLEITVDIVNGEIIEVGDLDTENIKNIGSMVDYSDFVEGIRYHADNGIDIPYIPCLDVQVTALPYFKLKCLKCGQISLSCSYMAKHKGCGGILHGRFCNQDLQGKDKRKGTCIVAYASSLYRLIAIITPIQIIL